MIHIHSPTAWMSKTLSYEWLSSFDQYINRTLNCRAVMIINNASCLGLVGKFPTLRNVKVIYLPAKATSRIQIFVDGMIASLKRSNRLQQLDKAVDLLEEDEIQNFYITDLEMAMTTNRCTKNAI